MEDYIDILCDCVEVLPENVVIHRLTGDGDKKLLVAPMWSADKKRVLNSINREFAKRDITQEERQSKRLPNQSSEVLFSRVLSL